MDLSWVVSLKEDDFLEKDEFPYAPKDYKDAVDNYKRVLELVGDIAGNFVAPRASEVDKQGARLENNEVRYAKGTKEALDRLVKADLMGFTLPRIYGGINMPKVVYSIAIEIVSRADASLMNLFGLQEIADTICKFGSQEQKKLYLPRFCSGEVTGAMALTEPDAGSDLQSIMLRAKQEEDGKWYLNGVKRFITNGCAEISLVMARSEAGISGGRGISLFIYERDPNMTIRRLENKLGIHGSPTTELQFNNAPAELLGRRKMGLVKYTMSLMNGARVAVAAQAIGIAEAAYREAYKYANERIQFKRPIKEFSAIYEMLTEMKVEIELGRKLLYETSRIVDIAEGLEEKIERQPEKKTELKDELRRYTKYASLLTPGLKAYVCELANKICYQALQIHGGPGYTKDFDVERHYRDVRVTNIYEGTTQLQILAAIGGVITGVVSELLNDYQESYNFNSVSDLFAVAQELRTHLESAIAHIKEKNDGAFQEYHSKRLVEMGMETIMAYLVCIDAINSERKRKVAQVFLSKAKQRSRVMMNFIVSNDTALIENYKDIIDKSV